MRNAEIDLEAFSSPGFSKVEVLLILSRIRYRPVATSTFYRWCGYAGVTPPGQRADESNAEYSPDAVRRLVQVCRHYSHGRTKTLSVL